MKSDELKVGDKAPAFQATAVGGEYGDGRSVALRDFRGAALVLYFYPKDDTPGCTKEACSFRDAWAKFKKHGITVLGVSLDQPGAKEKWLKAISDDQLTWTHVSELKYWNNEVAQQYGISAIPQNFLLDPSGKIVAKNIRGEALEKTVAEMIK